MPNRIVSPPSGFSKSSKLQNEPNFAQLSRQPLRPLWGLVRSAQAPLAWVHRLEASSFRVRLVTCPAPSLDERWQLREEDLDLSLSTSAQRSSPGARDAADSALRSSGS